MKKTIEFRAHKTVKKPTEVQFKTKSGKSVDFVADKKTKVPIRVRFRAESK